MYPEAALLFGFEDECRGLKEVHPARVHLGRSRVLAPTRHAAARLPKSRADNGVAHPRHACAGAKCSRGERARHAASHRYRRLCFPQQYDAEKERNVETTSR